MQKIISGLQLPLHSLKKCKKRSNYALITLNGYFKSILQREVNDIMYQISSLVHKRGCCNGMQAIKQQGFCVLLLRKLNCFWEQGKIPVDNGFGTTIECIEDKYHISNWKNFDFNALLRWQLAQQQYTFLIKRRSRRLNWILLPCYFEKYKNQSKSVFFFTPCIIMQKYIIIRNFSHSIITKTLLDQRMVQHIIMDCIPF